jgi:tetratricopeptide (TPR) repeat protein
MTRASKTFAAIALAFLLCTPLAVAQEKISPISDYQYKKDYAEVEGIVKEADLQKRADLLVAFIKQHPISRMLDYVVLQYLECVKPSIQKKDWSRAISMEESFLALMPTEKAVQAAALPVGSDEFIKKQVLPSQKVMYQSLMAAYFQSNNLPKAAEMGEKVYALSPDKTMVATLADIYLRMQNYDKYLSFGDKILADYPIDQAYQTALTMAQIYFQKQNAAKGMDLLSKVVEAFPDKTPPNMKEETWNAQRAFYWNQKAAEAYRQKDYTKAIEEFERSIKYSPKGDDTPYYYIGMSKWNSKDPEGAIPYFAKAMVLGKANSAKAKQYLEELYKARHNDSLDGLDQVLSKAKADLGIS